jgi:hypothetical protein
MSSKLGIVLDSEEQKSAGDEVAQIMAELVSWLWCRGENTY